MSQRHFPSLLSENTKNERCFSFLSFFHFFFFFNLFWAWKGDKQRSFDCSSFLLVKGVSLVFYFILFFKCRIFNLVSSARERSVGRSVGYSYGMYKGFWLEECRWQTWWVGKRYLWSFDRLIILCLHLVWVHLLGFWCLHIVKMQSPKCQTEDQVLYLWVELKIICFFFYR